jgi:hypothetical protein
MIPTTSLLSREREAWRPSRAFSLIRDGLKDICAYKLTRRDESERSHGHIVVKLLRMSDACDESRSWLRKIVVRYVSPES